MVAIKGDIGFHRIYDYGDEDVDIRYEAIKRYRKTANGYQKTKEALQRYELTEKARERTRHYREKSFIVIYVMMI